jgi:hypothetical protein
MVFIIPKKIHGGIKRKFILLFLKINNKIIITITGTIIFVIKKSIGLISIP